MRRQLHTFGLGAAGLALAVGGACNDFGFEQQDEVSKLRTLAIRFEPAELAPGSVVTADSLTVDPRGGEPIRYVWELCAFREGPDDAFACATADDGTPLGVTIAETPTATISYDAVTAVVGTADALCAALADAELPPFIEVPNCERGFPLTVRMTARVGAGEGDDVEIAVKQLLLLREDVVPNDNPRIDGVVVAGEPTDPSTTLVIPTEPDVSTALQVLVGDDQAETWLDGATGTDVTEELALSWYTTHGRFDRSVTYYDAELVPLVDLQSNDLDLDRGVVPQPGDVVTLWLVLRDDRGGTAYTSVAIERGP